MEGSLIVGSKPVMGLSSFQGRGTELIAGCQQRVQGPYGPRREYETIAEEVEG